MLTANKEALPDTSVAEIRPAMRYAGTWSFLVPGVLATFYLATSIYISSHRLLWFDEVVTVHMARLPDSKTLLAALSHGADSLPPLYYDTLVVLPAWQCGPRLSPGGVYGYRYFGFLATEQKMRTNSYYTARSTGKALEYHCDGSAGDFTSLTLSPDTAYVGIPAIAVEIEKIPAGEGKCHNLDESILCSPKTDFGLGPLLKTDSTGSSN